MIDLPEACALAERARENTADGLTAREELPGLVDRLAVELREARSLRLAHPADAVDPGVHTPERVRAHLRRLGWAREAGGRTAELWHPVGAPGPRVTVPLIPTAPDYAKRLGFLVSDLADLYGPGQLVVLASIAAAEVPTGIDSSRTGSNGTAGSAGTSEASDA